MLKTNRLGAHIKVASEFGSPLRLEYAAAEGTIPNAPSTSYAAPVCIVGKQRIVTSPSPPLLVNDVALGIQCEFGIQAADSAHASDGPDCAELLLMRRRRRPDDELLEAVFEAPLARMTSGDSFGTSLIDRGGQGYSRPEFL